MRNSGVIYNSTFEQIKKLYGADPEKAGELAISAIELVLCGEISSDDMLVDLMLAPIKKINESNHIKHDAKVNSAKEKRMYDLKLDAIAELCRQGFKQREIGSRLNLSQQIISYRMGIIRSEYPELLQTNYKQNQENTNDTNNLQTKYKQNTNNTKIQKDTKFVQTCTKDSFVKSSESNVAASQKNEGQSEFSF